MSYIEVFTTKITSKRKIGNTSINYKNIIFLISGEQLLEKIQHNFIIGIIIPGWGIIFVFTEIFKVF